MVQSSEEEKINSIGSLPWFQEDPIPSAHSPVFRRLGCCGRGNVMTYKPRSGIVAEGAGIWTAAYVTRVSIFIRYDELLTIGRLWEFPTSIPASGSKSPAKPRIEVWTRRSGPEDRERTDETTVQTMLVQHLNRQYHPRLHQILTTELQVMRFIANLPLT